MMETRTTTFKHVENKWDDAVARELDPLGRLVYRSNLLGTDWRITNTGGGNTSSKLVEQDPVTGETVEVLWVKGSGGDLRTAERENFASLYQDQLLALQDTYAQFEERGPKTLAEDQMANMLRHATFDLNPRAPSIDTPLHSFIPHRHVDHTHPVACIAIATAENGEALTRAVYGEDVIWVDWQRPGFELGLTMQEVCEAHPEARGIMLGGHGLINWADDDKACYLRSLALIDRAAEYIEQNRSEQHAFGGWRYEELTGEERRQLLVDLLPWLRGQISRERRLIATVETDPDVLDFVGSANAPRLAELGTSCPDHFLRTKIKPLYVAWDPQTKDLDALKKALADGLVAYTKDYRDYYETHKNEASPDIRNPYPTVVLIPGLGMIAWGKNKSESRVTAEFYKAAIAVMRGAESISTYTALPRQEAFDIEYWRLEEAKLQRMPPEDELSRQIAVVVGAGSGIGKVLCRRLVNEGATVAAVDVDAPAAAATADTILDEIGMGIGVAGTGISGSGDIIGFGCDATSPDSIEEALDQVVLAYGGIDQIAFTAGVYASPDEEGNNTKGEWEQSFSVNSMGPYLVARHAARRWSEQKLSGSMVVTTSVNGVVAKQGSLAYDASKAAANHLVRELAVELAPLVRVNGVAPATVVEGSSMFPRDRVIASLAKYELPYDEDEDTAVLRERLARFYADRTLTKQPIRPADQAEAIFLLLSDRLGKTTGQILTVDGGLKDAFLR